MARYWRAFATQEERKAWEQEQKEKDTEFRVCFHYSARDLEKEMYMPKGQLTDQGLRYCTVYGFKSTM